MPETRVIHFRDWDRSDPNSVYIGRAVPRKGLKASPWANPFRVHEDRNHRDCVLVFRIWSGASLDPEAVWIREHVHELRGKTLVCWCKPDHPCHGDALAEMAEEAKETVNA